MATSASQIPLAHHRRYPESLTAILFVLPFLILFFVFFFIPSVLSLLVSFFSFDLFEGTLKFQGIKNYVRMFSDELFYKSALNIGYYNLIVVPSSIILSLLLAIFVNTKHRGIDLFRSIYFLPAVVALVALGFAWRWMLGVEGGWLNYYIGKVGIQPHPWLNDQKTALTTVTFVAVWESIAAKMIIFLAGLKAVPDEYYEAARMDGVNPFQNFFYITLPSIRNTTFFVTVITVIEEIKVFAKPYILTRGGLSTNIGNVVGGEPNYSTLTMVGYIYGLGFRLFEFGYGAAMSMFLLVVTIIFTAIQFRFYSRQLD